MEHTNTNTQNDACLSFWDEQNKNAYSYGQYGGTAKDRYYVYKKGSIGHKAIKEFKFTKENQNKVLEKIYAFLDQIGGTKIFENNKFLKSFKNSEIVKMSVPINTYLNHQNNKIENINTQLTLF